MKYLLNGFQIDPARPRNNFQRLLLRRQAMKDRLDMRPHARDFASPWGKVHFLGNQLNIATMQNRRMFRQLQQQEQTLQLLSQPQQRRPQ